MRQSPAYLPRHWAAPLLAAILCVGVLAAQGAPAVLVERHRTLGNTTTRVTLFDNRMSVATVRENGKQVFLRQLTLDTIEFDVYVQVLEEVADTAGREGDSSVDSDEAEVFITISLPDMSPRQISFSPLQVLGLETARLTAMLNDLELRVCETSPSHEALRDWSPSVGDRVVLFTETHATVSEVRENGMVVLVHDDTGIIELVPQARLSQVIMRVLP